MQSGFMGHILMLSCCELKAIEHKKVTDEFKDFWFNVDRYTLKELK